MKNVKVLLPAVVLLAGTSGAAEKPVYPAPAKPLRAEYTIYSGELGNEQVPTKNDRKLAVEVSGPAAKEIFDSLYPDSKVTCSEEKGERLRSKGHVWCSYTPSDGHRCFFGFNLRTGQSIPGGSC